MEPVKTEFVAALGIYFNKYLKDLRDDESRLKFLAEATDGICTHCGAVTDRCCCMWDD